MSRQQIIKSFLLLVILLIILSLWWRGQLQPLSQTEITVEQVKCDPIQKNCVAKMGDGEVMWYVENPIHYLKPFTSKVQFKNIAGDDVLRVSIEFSMQGMEMAMNRSEFTQQGNDRWQAQSILPICASGRKDWLAVVRIETTQGLWQTGFEFVLTGK